MIYHLDNHEDFNPDTDLGMSHDEQTLTHEQVEERINAVLRGWGWTEELADEAQHGFDTELADDWDHDTNLAYTLACNAPSGTPLEIFTAVLEARGWPRTDFFE